MRWRRPLLIYLAAWTVRLIYVAQIRRTPFFDVPLVDGANYFRIASLIASGDPLGGPRVFWQPPLYPYFLAALLALFGSRMVIIYAVQAAIGALSCLFVYFIGRRTFGERPALGAAMVMILYGPLIHFDAQPLIPVLHIALVLAGLLLLLRGDAAGSGRDSAVAGLAWGLGAIATPNILLAVPPVALWVLRRRDRREAWPGTKAVAAALFLLGVAAPVSIVAARNLAVAGELVPISSNGGINFYLGNNADYEQTIRIRPGGEFERLAQEPENLGIVTESGRSRYFTLRALRFLGDYPRDALRLYARKALDLVAGREIPRNQESYPFRRDSWLLALLLWRLGISFPFGVVAPLALAGALLAPRGDRGAGGRGRILLLVYAAAYAASILIFFPTDRYRLPLVPVAALFAGNLLGAPRAAWRRPTVAAALLLGLVLFNLDLFAPSEGYPEEEALNRAYAFRMKGRLDEAREEYRRAIALNPERVDAYNSLAAMAAQEGRWGEAAQHYQRLLAIAPDFVEVRHDLGQAYLALGRKDDARREWQIAANLAPGAGIILADLCLSFRDEGAFEAAGSYCDRAVRARPDLPETHFARGLLLRALRNEDEARAEIGEAARLFPADGPGRRRAEEILHRMEERGRGARRPREEGPGASGTPGEDGGR